MSRGARALDVILGALGEVLVTIGVLILLFVGWQLWWTDAVANHQQTAVADDLIKSWQDAPPPPLTPGGTSPSDPAAPPVPAEPGKNGAFGVLHIPRFGAGWAPRPIVEGTSMAVLEDGVGHYKNAALPGEVGNLALAGHRVTYGRPFFQIDTLRDGDPIVVETLEGWYTYRMTSREIVRPSDVRVIEPVPNEPGVEPTERYITLTACHPKYSAAQRYIVHGLFESFQPREAGPPASLAGGG